MTSKKLVNNQPQVSSQYSNIRIFSSVIRKWTKTSGSVFIKNKLLDSSKVT